MPKPRLLTPGQAKASLANRLGGRVDRIRQISTNLGIRPYTVWLTWLKYPGRRGQGVPTLYKRVALLPNPKVTNIDTLNYVSTSLGSLPIGSVRVDKVSVTYTEDFLQGRDSGQDEVPEDIEFFYEIVQDGRGDEPAQRTKYRIASPPYLQAGKVGYSLVLERIGGSDLDRNGNVPEPDC